MTDTSLRNNLEFIVKSHACTQVNFDKYASEDYPKMIDAILKIIDKEVRKAEIRGVKRATGGYAYTMPIKSVRSRNTAFKLYAVKFFNGVIKKRRESILSELQAPQEGADK